MSSQDVESTTQTHGDVLTAISDGMVALLKEFYGRGPTRTKSYYEDDHQQHPDMMCEIFILAPTDLVDIHEIPASGPPSSSL